MYELTMGNYGWKIFKYSPKNNNCIYVITYTDKKQAMRAFKLLQFFSKKSGKSVYKMKDCTYLIK